MSPEIFLIYLINYTRGFTLTMKTYYIIGRTQKCDSFLHKNWNKPNISQTWLFLVLGKVQIGKGFAISWDGNPFTIGDGIIVYVIFST